MMNLLYFCAHQNYRKEYQCYKRFCLAGCVYNLETKA